MIDVLKKFAAQKIQEQFAPNSLNEADTAAASNEGANALLAGLMDQVKGGNINQLKSLLGGQADVQNNDFANGMMQQMQNVLQKRGLSAQEAQQNAAAATPQLLNGLKERFLSPKSEDADFDLEKLQDLTGNAGGLMNMAKGLFGKN